MQSKALSAVFLALIMLLSGCFGSGTDDSVEDSVTEPEVISVNAYSLQTMNSEYSVGDIVLVEGTVEIYPVDTSRDYEYEIRLPSGIVDIENSFTDSGDGVKLIFAPEEPGFWLVSIRLIVEGIEEPIVEQVSFYVNPPDEGDTILSTDSVIEMELSLIHI